MKCLEKIVLYPPMTSWYLCGIQQSCLPLYIQHGGSTRKGLGRGCLEEDWKLDLLVEGPSFLWSFCHSSRLLHHIRCVVCRHVFRRWGHLFFMCRRCWRAVQLELIQKELAECTSLMVVVIQILQVPSEQMMHGCVFSSAANGLREIKRITRNPSSVSR